MCFRNGWFVYTAHILHGQREALILVNYSTANGEHELVNGNVEEPLNLGRMKIHSLRVHVGSDTGTVAFTYL